MFKRSNENHYTVETIRGDRRNPAAALSKRINSRKTPLVPISVGRQAQAKAAQPNQRAKQIIRVSTKVVRHVT